MKKTWIYFLIVLTFLAISTAAISYSNGKSKAESIKANEKMPDGKEVVMTINGETVTKAEYLTILKLQEDVTKDLLDEKTNLENNTNLPAEKKQQILKELEQKLQAGEEIRAFSYFLTNYSLMKKAQEQNIAISLDEAKQISNKKRTQFEKEKNKPENGEINDFITTMGEDSYWNEYAPKKYQIFGSVGKIKNKVVGNVDKSQRKEIWNTFVIEEVTKAEVVIKDTNVVKVTKQEVLDYKKSYSGEQ